MPSFLENVKNFSYFPLKKRPLQYLVDDLNTGLDAEADEPQDLRVKRRKESDENDDLFVKRRKEKEVLSSWETSSHDISPLPIDASPPPANIPSSVCLIPKGLPPPYPTEDTSPEVLTPRPLADFYLHLFQHSAAAAAANAVYHQSQQQQFSGWDGSSWTPVAASRWSPLPQQQTTEPHLSSPRSTTSSEDSGMGSEVIMSEEEPEVGVLPASASQYLCTACGKSYSTQAGLRKHGELHCSGSRVPTKTFSCKHCAKTYTSVGALKMHIRTHTLPCKCHVCGKAFSRPWLLQGHIRTHTGEKPFECNQCHRSFADRSNLRAHQQTHERVKKYACHKCHKTFSRMSLLNKHSQNACPGILQ